MAVKIRASPRIRDARPQDRGPQPAKPRIVVRDGVEKPPSPSGGATRILKVTFNRPEVYERLGSRAQMNPPIRDEAHRQGLWRGIEQGINIDHRSA